MALTLSGCVQTQWRQSAYGPTQTLKTADQTMDLELTDRVARLARLSRMEGIVPPQIEQATLPAAQVPNAGRPIPVIRVTFDESDFFDPGSAMPRAAGARVLRVISEDLRRDVPDIRLTVLGHTDASGSEQTNTTLSRDRATEVVRILVAEGANPGQLDAVAIGDAQPIAPNSSPSGRARNRRVEFLISPSDQANLTVVSLRPVNADFLATGLPATGRSAAAPAKIRRVAVLKPSYAGPVDFSETPAASRSRSVTLAAAGPGIPVGGDEASGSPVMSSVTAPPSGPAGRAADSGSPVFQSTADYRENRK